MVYVIHLGCVEEDKSHIIHFEAKRLIVKLHWLLEPWFSYLTTLSVVRLTCHDFQSYINKRLKFTINLLIWKQKWNIYLVRASFCLFMCLSVYVCTCNLYLVDFEKGGGVWNVAFLVLRNPLLLVGFISTWEWL